MMNRTSSTPRFSVRCNATRREKHSNLRQKYSGQRRLQDEKLKASFASIAKDERERISSIWNAHKEFFAREPKSKDESVVEPIVIDNEDLEKSNDFFE